MTNFRPTIFSIIKVLFSEFVQVLVGQSTSDGDDGVWGEAMQYEQLCHQQRQAIQKIVRKMPKHHASTKRVKQVAVISFFLYQNINIPFKYA